MKRQSFELDPRGDVCLILRQPNQQELIWNPSASVTPSSDQGEEEKSDESAEPKPESEGKLPGGLDEPNESNEPEEVQFRLSSRHLCLASPVFNAMLSGDWKESNGTFESPEKVTEMESRKTSDTRLQLRYEIAATEWNVEAFTLLMNIIHGHHRKVPRSIDLDTLAMVSVLVDYYKCHEITDVFAQIWVVKLSPGLPTSYGRESMIWLFVSWVFSESLIFQQMTALVMKEGDCSLETTSLPLPPLLLGDIEQKRISALHLVLRALHDLREDLSKGSKGCSFECSSMTLGVLIKGMDKHKLNQDQLPDSFSDQSLKQFKSLLLAFEKPTWFSYLSDQRYLRPCQHPCSVQSMLEPAIQRVCSNLDGLKLQDYRACR